MGASSGILIAAKQEPEFPKADQYRGRADVSRVGRSFRFLATVEEPYAPRYRHWPPHAVELCLEKYLSLRPQRPEASMDGKIVITLNTKDLEAWRSPPFGLSVEPLDAAVDRIAAEGHMEKTSIRRARSALKDEEVLVVRRVAPGSPAELAGVEADWLLSTVCGRTARACGAVATIIGEVEARGDGSAELQFVGGPFNHSSPPPATVSRPLWLHVFCDPTEMDREGRLLQLPIDCMAPLAEAFPAPHAAARPRPALLLLALLCADQLPNKLQMVFQCLDLRNREAIAVADLGESVSLLCAVLKYLGFLKAELHEAGRAELAASLAAHAVDGALRTPGFVAWGTREAKGGLLARLARAAPGALGRYRKPAAVTDVGGRVVVFARRARERRSLVDDAPSTRVETGPPPESPTHATHTNAQAAHSREAHARARRKYASGVAEKDDRKIGLAMARAKKTGRNQYELERERKIRDGRVRAVASQATMARLVTQVSCSYEDLHHLRIEYAAAADKKTVHHGPYMTTERLKEMLLARFPALEEGRVLEDMLRVFDVDHNGRISFREFALSLAKLVGSFEQQMRFVFSMADGDRDGKLEFHEFSDLISDASDDMKELGEHVKQRLVQLAFPTERGAAVELLDFESMLKGDEHLHLNFFWTWLPHTSGRLLAGLELLEACATDAGVPLDVSLALRLCPKFAHQGKLATRADGRLTPRMFAEVLYEALGWEVPASESFRRPDEDPADDDDRASPVPKEDEVREPAGTTQKFFAAPVPAPDPDRLRRAVGVVFSETLKGFAKIHEARHKDDELEYDMFGEVIKAPPSTRCPAVRLWAVVAHYCCARGCAGATKSTRNLDLVDKGVDFDSPTLARGIDSSRGFQPVEVHPNHLVSIPHAVQAALIARAVAFNIVTDAFHPDPAVSPASSKRLGEALKVPLTHLIAFAEEVIEVNGIWEVQLAEAFAEMDADDSGEVDFEELLRYARMNRELFQLLIGTGNRHTKGMIDYTRPAVVATRDLTGCGDKD